MCTTASRLDSANSAAKTSATASGSAQSAVCQAPSTPSGGTRSSPTTSWPRSARPTESTRPMLPAAPVRSTRTGGNLQSRHDLGEQRTHPRRSGAPCLEDLVVVEWLAADAGRQVGDEADAEHLHPGLAGRDRLEGGAHAHELTAQNA